MLVARGDRNVGFPEARVDQWELDGTGPDDRRCLYLEPRVRPVATLRRDRTLANMQF